MMPSGQASDPVHALAGAFTSFTEAAASLERSYGRLQSEVERLRRELEQRNADLERSLQENTRIREWLRRILENLPCGVVVVGEAGAILSANPEGQRLLALTEAAASGDLTPPLLTLLDQACAEGVEWEVPAVGGERCWLQARSAPLGRAEQVVILEDVSSARRLAEDRQRLERQRALAEMAVVLAHEVRNPLGSLELFAGLLAESDLPDEPRAWVDQLQAGLRLLTSTVNNVLDFHSAPAPAMAATDLGQLLSGLRDFLGPLARAANVELVLANELDGVVALVDRHRLEQILLNLARNALRVMPVGGRLSIAAKRRQVGPLLMAEIAVTDTGPGIAESLRERLFTPGFTTQPGSPGLGLTVCRTIAEQHGGTICVDPAYGPGARFLLQLPLENP